MFVTAGDATIFTIAFGPPAAPTILGIGGWIGSWELWAQPFSQLSASWHTIAYDHRGSGATIAPIASISFDTLVDGMVTLTCSSRLSQLTGSPKPCRTQR